MRKSKQMKMNTCFKPSVSARSADTIHDPGSRARARTGVCVWLYICQGFLELLSEGSPTQVWNNVFKGFVPSGGGSVPAPAMPSVDAVKQRVVALKENRISCAYLHGGENGTWGWN